jgi:hypothetical protein
VAGHGNSGSGWGGNHRCILSKTPRYCLVFRYMDGARLLGETWDQRGNLIYQRGAGVNVASWVGPRN